MISCMKYKYFQKFQNFSEKTMESPSKKLKTTKNQSLDNKLNLIKIDQCKQVQKQTKQEKSKIASVNLGGVISSISHDKRQITVTDLTGLVNIKITNLERFLSKTKAYVS